MEATTSTACEHDIDYRHLHDAIAQRIRPAEGPLFITDADPDAMWRAYLNNIPAANRQHYNCHACRHFIQRFGGLVTIAPDGVTEPLLWTTGVGIMAAPVERLRKLVSKARVKAPFLSSLETWGTPITGEWTHLHGENPSVFRPRLKTAGQVMAEKREEYAMLRRGLADYSRDTLHVAAELLERDALYRADKTKERVAWLLDLHDAMKPRRGRARDNVVWLRVAVAPAGWCHVRSSVIGTLLDDIASGKSFAAVERAWKAKMHPLAYRRPQAPPKAGAIDQAEKIVAELGVERSLARRFARLDDLDLLWSPSALAEESKTGGVFAHLRQKGQDASRLLADAPAKAITWEKFAATALPGAAKIEVSLGSFGQNIYAMTAAVHDDAPNIFQWDNTVAWYVYNGGSPPHQWGIAAGWNDVTGVSLLPFMWGERPLSHHEPGAMFVLKGCADTQNSSAAIFPSCLRSDFHQIRSVIEAHSRRGRLEGQEDAGACGMVVRKGGDAVTVRVTDSAGMVSKYKIDRWD